MKTCCMETLRVICLLLTIGSVSCQTTQQMKPKSITSDVKNVSLMDLNQRLRCYFTLELFTLGGGRQSLSSFDIHTREYPSKIANITDVVKALKKRFPSCEVLTNSQGNVIHLVERVLAARPDYALTRHVSIDYTGFLGSGRDEAHATYGLVPALQKQIPTLTIKTEGSLQNLFNDFATRVSIKATNETARDILTKAVPLSGYSAVLWRAESIESRGVLQTVHQFYGPR